MNLTEEQLKEIESMGDLLLPIALVAANIECSELELRMEFQDSDSPAYKAYMRGVGLRQVKLHQSILRSADNGSNPAQIEALKFLAQLKNDFQL